MWRSTEGWAEVIAYGLIRRRITGLLPFSCIGCLDCEHLMRALGSVPCNLPKIAYHGPFFCLMFDKEHRPEIVVAEFDISSTLHMQIVLSGPKVQFP